MHSHEVRTYMDACKLMHSSLLPPPHALTWPTSTLHPRSGGRRLHPFFCHGFSCGCTWAPDCDHCDNDRGEWRARVAQRASSHSRIEPPFCSRHAPRRVCGFHRAPQPLHPLLRPRYGRGRDACGYGCQRLSGRPCWQCAVQLSERSRGGRRRQHPCYRLRQQPHSLPRHDDQQRQDARGDGRERTSRRPH
jgi:hypothetical protein